jgi:RNA polymerase sigma factor (sigma-70 family)
MTKETKKYDLDLAQLADEALVILVQECTFQPATDELVLRYYERMNQLIALRIRHLRNAADVQDAQQNGVFAILEAIAGYDTLELAKPRGCSFRTFVRLVVTARCCDFVKHVRRTEKRYRRLDECRAERGSDLVQALAQQEETARLHCALERLDEPIRRLWHELASGKKMPQIAREQGIAYDRVKRQRQRLLAQLAAALADPRPAGRPYPSASPDFFPRDYCTSVEKGK